MNIVFNEEELDKKLEELECIRAWGARVVSKFESFIRTEEDFQLFRVNPLVFATERNINEKESIDLFLFATKVGLFQMNWELMCPNCGSPTKSFSKLKSVHTDFYCTVCQLHSEASLDDMIQVSFTITPSARTIGFHDPSSLSTEDYIYKYFYHRGAYINQGGPSFSDVAASLDCAHVRLAPGEVRQFEIELTDGWLHLEEFAQKSGLRFTIDGEVAAQPQYVTVNLRNQEIETDATTITPGILKLTFKNCDQSEDAVFAAYRLPLEYVSAPIIFDPFLTGNRLLSTQTFRELFRSEVIGGTQGIRIKDLTVMFTDLQSSTALYDRIGDLNAFSLVNQHFETLSGVIEENNGAIVKTIGDAVMATFVNSVDSLNAAVQIIERIKVLNNELSSEEVVLKIGLHNGTLIAVTLNDRLDFFGQTVNIAARVQGMAKAEQICFTNSIYAQPHVAETLTGYEVSATEAALRGIERSITVHTLAI